MTEDQKRFSDELVPILASENSVLDPSDAENLARVIVLDLPPDRTAGPELYDSCLELIRAWDDPTRESVQRRCDAVLKIRIAIGKVQSP